MRTPSRSMAMRSRLCAMPNRKSLDRSAPNRRSVRDASTSTTYRRSSTHPARSSSSDSARRSARMDSLRLPTKLVSSLRNHECSVRERASNSEHVAARTNIHTDWRAPAACTM